jgi:hypothetical protein
MSAASKGSLAMTAAAGLPATALKNKVATMPTATADAGNAGDYAVDGSTLAIYVSGTGWMFFTGFQQ